MSDITVEAATAEIVPVTIAPLASMRCDICDAQAYVEIETPAGGRLEFCAHHYEKQKDALLAKAKRIIDYRATLRQLEGDDRR